MTNLLSSRHRLLFMLVILLFPYSLSAQKEMVLSLYNPVADDFSGISISASVDAKRGHFMDFSDYVTYTDHRAAFVKALDAPSFISIRGDEYIGRRSIVMAPGDSLMFALTPTAGNQYALTISGDHNDAVIYTVNHALLDPEALKIPNVFRSDKSSREAFSELLDYYRGLIMPLDSIAGNEVSNPYYQTLKEEFDQAFLLAVTLRLSPSSSDSRVAEVRELAYAHWMPFDEKYQDTRYGWLNRDRLAADPALRKKMLDRPYKKLDIWPSKSAYRSLLSVDDQQHLMASEMAIQRSSGTDTDDMAYLTKLRFFANTFPDSPYYTYLDKLLTDRRIADNAYTFGMYDAERGQYFYLDRYPETDLSEIIRRQFPGRPVLVDVWATYCQPCRVEFAHAEEVNAWAARNGVVLLFVSVDQPIQSARWLSTIAQYRLTGFHYYGTMKAFNAISKLGKGFMTIPRYLLFGADGQLLDDRLPRPSDPDEAMFKRMEALLKN